MKVIALRQLETGKIRRRSEGDSGVAIVYAELHGAVPTGMELIGVGCDLAGVREVEAIPPMGQKLDP